MIRLGDEVAQCGIDFANRKSDGRVCLIGKRHAKCHWGGASRASWRLSVELQAVSPSATGIMSATNVRADLRGAEEIIRKIRR